jgi:hypothetical protein
LRVSIAIRSLPTRRIVGTTIPNRLGLRQPSRLSVVPDWSTLNSAAGRLSQRAWWRKEQGPQRVGPNGRATLFREWESSWCDVFLRLQSLCCWRRLSCR